MLAGRSISTGFEADFKVLDQIRGAVVPAKMDRSSSKLSVAQPDALAALSRSS